MSLDVLSSDQIQVVLVGTTLSKNIGSAARAMKTMGLETLCLVAPACTLDDSAYATAAGGTSILDQALVVDTLEEALAQSSMVAALTGRSRKMNRVSLPLNQACAQWAAQFQASAAASNLKPQDQPAKASEGSNTQRLSLVFGREDRGLTNTELSLCQQQVYIPANPDYGVLNLAQAVQVCAYELRSALLSASDFEHSPAEHELTQTYRTAWDEPAARHDQHLELERLVLEALTKHGLLDPKNPRKNPERIRRLIQRLHLDTSEYNILRAALAKVLS